MGFLAKQDSSATTPSKSFWSTKEGKFGAFGIALMVIAGVIGLTKLLPILTAFVNGAADLTVALARAGFIIGGFGLLIYTLTRPKMRTMLFYWYRGLMSLMVNGYINKNYIQIMNTYIERMQEKLLVINGNIKDVARNKGVLDTEIKEYKQMLESELNRGRAAKKKREETVDEEERSQLQTVISTVNGRLGTISDTIKVREASSARLEMMIKVLRKLKGYSDTMVDRMSFKVDTMVREYKTVSSAHNAFKSAWQIAYGGDEERQFFNQSMETITTKTGEKIGDIDEMMADFKTIMTSQDLDNSMFEESGRKLLEEWEAKIDAKLNDGHAFLEDHIDTPAEPVAIPAASASKESGASQASKWLK